MLKKKNNEDIVKKIGEIRVEENWRRLNRKWMGIIGVDMKACGIDENMVRDRKIKSRFPPPLWRIETKIHFV